MPPVKPADAPTAASDAAQPEPEDCPAARLTIDGLTDDEIVFLAAEIDGRNTPHRVLPDRIREWEVELPAERVAVTVWRGVLGRYRGEFAFADVMREAFRRREVMAEALAADLATRISDVARRLDRKSVV
jgi:hypothetical protein